MNKLLQISFLFLFTCNLFSQQATDYFPSQFGHKWHFKNVTLDTLNNPIDSLSTYTIDTFATQINYKGLDSKLILSKTGALSTVLFQPFLDSNFVNLSGSTANAYFRVPEIDSTFLIDTNFIKLFALLKSFEKWYPIFKFGQSVNQEYQIFKYDTTITIDTLTLPLRFELKGKRFNDQTIQSEIGNFNCKKFLETFSISYVAQILPPPFPPLIIPLFNLKDTIWIAPQNWIVKHFTPSSVIDLSYLGFPKFSFPGQKREIIPTIIFSSIDDKKILGKDFYLFQNYPNPWNPVTTINYQVPTKSFVLLKIFDLLGREVITLVNEEKLQGRYSVEFNGSKLSSGVYLYELKAGDFRSVKKMTLVK